MKKTFFAILALGVMATIYSSCSNKSDDDNTTIAFSVLSGSAAYRFDNSARDYNRDSDITYYDSAAIVMPTVVYNQDITSLQDSILAAAFDTVCDDHYKAMHGFFEHTAAEAGYHLTAVATDEDRESEADGYTLITGNVFSLTPRILTYVVNNNTYRPVAANGTTTTRYLTYYIPGGRMIDLEYIFTPEGLADLPGIIAAKAAEMVAQLGPTDITALPSMGNFYLDLDGHIVFVYQPSEVASHAQGEIGVPFYDFQLSDYMTAEGIALFGLDN